MEIRIFGNYTGAALYLLLHFNDREWYFVSFLLLLLLKRTQADGTLAGTIHPNSCGGAPVTLPSRAQSLGAPKRRAEVEKGPAPAPSALRAGGSAPLIPPPPPSLPPAAPPLRPAPMPSPLSGAVWSVFIPQEAIFRANR